MKKKFIKVIILILSILLICTIGIIFRYRLMFGVWNPYHLPDRINCYGRRYYISNLEPTEVVKNQEQLQIIKWPDNLTLKKLYMDPKSVIKVPSIIYLKTNDGKYQCYAISGSPD